MILVLIFWVITSFLCLAIGHICLSVIKNYCTERSEEPLEIQWLTQFLIGLSTITFLGNVANNWMGIGLFFFIAISAVCLLYAVYNLRTIIRVLKQSSRYIRQENSLILYVTILVIIIAASKASLLTENMDEMGYYLSTVKWIEQGPTVPGTGLLNGRIAINSAWHMSSAIFGFDFLYDGGTYDLNGLLFLFIYIIGLKAGLRLYKSESESPSADILLLSTLVFPFHNLIDSMDADYASIFIGTFLISQIFRRISQQKLLMIDCGYYGYVIVSLFLFTVKPFSGLFLLYPLIVSISHFVKKKYGPFIFLGTLSLLYLLPWLYKNYLISGYLIFPLRLFDLFDPVWKIPELYVRNMSLVVSEFAKIELIRADYLYSGVDPITILEWFPTWLDNNWKLWIGKFVIVLWPLCSVAMATELFLLKNKSTLWYFKLILFLIGLLWFFNFPSIRFGWAFLLSFIMLSILDFTNHLKIPKKTIFYAISIMVIISIGRNSISTIKALIDRPNFILPKSTPSLTDYKTIETNFIYYQSESEYCYDLLPCIPVHNPWTIMQKSEDMGDGFVIQKSE